MNKTIFYNKIKNIFREPKPKIFCIGANKTGTTSLEKALIDFGYKMGHQPTGELLLNSYSNSDWNSIIKYCYTADAFQDFPFSIPFTWLFIHAHFPNSKFILTQRDSEKWYKSIVSFHSKKFADGNRVPTIEDLKKATYRYKGYMWEAHKVMWKTPENDIYNKEIMINTYKTHNSSIRHFFKDKPNFLDIDLSDEKSYLKLCEFLNLKPLYNKFPHLNIT